MRLDLHVHTRHSGDSTVTPAGAVRKAKKIGLDGLAITDHDTARGWPKAVSEGRKRGVLVVQGQEIMTSKGELLALFLNEPVCSSDPLEVMDRIKSQGGILAVSHPFDRFRMPYREPEKIAKKLDAVEVFNAKVLKMEYNDRALEFCNRHGLARIGGSDSHSSFTIGDAYTLADTSDLEGFRNAILKRQTRVEGRMARFIWRLCPKVARLEQALGIK